MELGGVIIHSTVPFWNVLRIADVMTFESSVVWRGVSNIPVVIMTSRRKLFAICINSRVGAAPLSGASDLRRLNHPNMLACEVVVSYIGERDTSA